MQQSVYVNGTLTAGAKNTAYSGTSANNALLASGQTLAADEPSGSRFLPG
ncbi:hypothetical protein ACINK0_04015 [Deinococcus sp. VB343]|uniref:Uncharacterized protein n=1 Tax=Deinococcus sp. VB142 TaxID=3112952 RepID=A0AAU6Q0L3_9DEIO